MIALNFFIKIIIYICKTIYKIKYIYIDFLLYVVALFHDFIKLHGS